VFGAGEMLVNKKDRQQDSDCNKHTCPLKANAMTAYMPTKSPSLTVAAASRALCVVAVNMTSINTFGISVPTENIRVGIANANATVTIAGRKESEGGTTLGISAMDKTKERKHESPILAVTSMRVGSCAWKIFCKKPIFVCFSLLLNKLFQEVEL
jgi:hypothetical protein